MIELFRFIILPSMILLASLGIALIVLTTKAMFTRISRAFFILTGVAAIGIPISGVLHNLVFALLIKLFGEDMSTRMGDEPVFFILATIVCPAALLAGVIGVIILMAKKRIVP